MKNFTINSFLFLVILFFWVLSGCTNAKKETQDTNITIENAEMRLILGNDGMAKSLVHKSTGQECLMKGVRKLKKSKINDKR